MQIKFQNKPKIVNTKISIQLSKTTAISKLAIAVKINKSVDKIPISLCRIFEINSVFLVFSKIYLIRSEPIRIKGNTGSEKIISFEKSPKELEIYLKNLSSKTPKEIAKPENPRFIIKILKSAKIPILFFPFRVSFCSRISSVSERPKVLPRKMNMLPNIEEDKRPIVAIAKPRSKPFGKPSLLKLSPIIDAAP